MLKRWKTRASALASSLCGHRRTEEAPTTTKKRILVVDRYPGICQSLTALLGAEYEVATVAAPQDALAFLMEHDVDLVIMDTRLWQTSRLELLRFIKGRKPTAPVVLTSIALAEIQELEEKCGHEANGRILKPFENEKIRDMVERLTSV